MVTPTPQQEAKWQKLKTLARVLNLEVAANTHRAKNASEAVAVGRQHGVQLSFRPTLFTDFQKLSREEARYQRIIEGVALEKLGLRFVNGDVDVVAPPHLTDEDLIDYRRLDGFGWVIIAVGILIVVGAIGAAIVYRQKNDGLRRDYNKLLKDADTKYCENPNSAICQAWITRKSSQGYQERKSTIQRLEGLAREVGKSLVGGTKWGLILAIPLAAWLLFGKGKRNA